MTISLIFRRHKEATVWVSELLHGVSSGRNEYHGCSLQSTVEVLVIQEISILQPMPPRSITWSGKSLQFNPVFRLRECWDTYICRQNWL